MRDPMLADVLRAVRDGYPHAVARELLHEALEHRFVRRIPEGELTLTPAGRVYLQSAGELR